jgi:dienelactone hydrolase
VSILFHVPAAEAQTPPERRLMQDRVQLEQLPGTVTRALAAPGLDPQTRAEIQSLFPAAVQDYIGGRTGETRRVLYQAIALAIGREWTERDDYWRSLLLRTDTVVTDPARPLIVRLAQIYSTSYQPTSPLRLRTSVAGRDGKPVKEIGTFDAIGMDFIDGPFAFAVDLAGLDDGRYYQVIAEVLEGEKPLRRLSTPVYVMSNLDSNRGTVDRQLAKIEGHDSAKATVRYPFDFALQVNLGKVEARDYDFAAEIERSKELLAELEKGSDPLYGAVGDHKRHYWFAEAGEIMPYRVYVPTSYDGTRAYPLIVGLHGNGGTGDQIMDGADGAFREAAENEGYILVTPLGYRRTGSYGATTVMGVPLSPARRQVTRLSELDVMNVFELMLAEYEIDRDRIYLMGGSMGGGGTWRIASRTPEIWAAISPICPGITRQEIDLEGMRHIPVIVSHGDADTTVPVEQSRAMVAAMEELGMTYEYNEIAGGGHLIFAESLPRMMEFLGRYRKPTPHE